MLGRDARTAAWGCRPVRKRGGRGARLLHARRRPTSCIRFGRSRSRTRSYSDAVRQCDFDQINSEHEQRTRRVGTDRSDHGPHDTTAAMHSTGMTLDARQCAEGRSGAARRMTTQRPGTCAGGTGRSRRDTCARLQASDY